MMVTLGEQFRRDGVVCVRGALDPADLRLAQEGFEWCLANPSPAAQRYFVDTGTVFYQDLFNTQSWPHFRALLDAGRLPALVRDLLGTTSLWFFFEQVFLKEGGETRRTPWHQDTSYFPVAGKDLVVAWMSFDSIDAADALEFVRGSHRDTLFNGSSFNETDDTAPLYDEGDMPRLPDIEANRGAYDIVSWATEPGDLLLFHPSTLHGGAATRPGRCRRTLSLRFFGDDCKFVERPAVSTASTVGFNREKSDSRDISYFTAGLKSGDDFRHPEFIRLFPGQASA